MNNLKLSATMKILFSTLVILSIFSINLIGQNVSNSSKIEFGFSIKINSEYLNDSVKLLIHQPRNYKPDKEYPIITLLDAKSSYKAFTACAELM